LIGETPAEAAFCAVVARLRDATLLAHSSGEVRYANPAAAEMLGRPHTDLAGLQLAALATGAPDAISAFLRAASRTTAPVLGSVNFLGADGATLPCRWEGSVLSPASASLPALLLIRILPRETAVNRFVTLNLQHAELTREVARRRAVEAALRESEQRFRMMADEMPQLAWIARPDGSIYWYNRRWYEYTGATPEEMAGWGWQKVHDPKHLPEVMARWTQALTAGTRFEMAFPLRGRDGRFRTFLTLVSPFRDPSGAIVHWFGTNTDVSAQHEAEEALRAADRRKDEFLATLAHELRNPLAPIRNSITLMAMAGPLPEGVESARQIVERQVRHLSRLVDDLLDVARITQGKVQLRRERMSLLQSVREALEAIAPAVDSARHQLHVTLPPDPLYADADGTRMTQIFLNLLNNAVKFTPPGGHVWATAERDGAHAIVTVRDTGAGIAEEHLESVFEMFSQPTPVLDRSEGGLGIGLALVRGLVELHGGSVRASSPGRGMGSEFVVRLPLAEAAPETEEAERPAGPGTAMPRKRILVVDDNVDAATSLRRLLEASGHEVREAHDGIEGIHAAGAFRPQVVLLDIGMPRMNGYDAAREIRKQANGSPIRIVALTGWGQESDRRLAEESGFDVHLTKPVDLDVLKKLLQD